MSLKKLRMLRISKGDIRDPRYIEIGYREVDVLSPRVRKKLFRFIQRSLSRRREEGE